jgi:hypothetical protein
MPGGVWTQQELQSQSFTSAASRTSGLVWPQRWQVRAAGRETCSGILDHLAPTIRFVTNQPSQSFGLGRIIGEG